MDKESLIDEYKNLLKCILEATDTTDKQALSLALILLADMLACECIFNDRPLTIEQVKKYVVPESAVRTEERAYDEVISLVSRNVNKFSEDANDSWGRISGDIVAINKQVLEQELNKMGFDFDSIKKGWDKKGYIIKNSAGRYVHQTRVNGIKGNYIKVKLPDTGFEEVDGKTPFDYEQEELSL